MLSKICQLKKNILHDDLHEMCKIVKLIRDRVEWWLPAAIGKGKEGLFNGHRVSVLQDQKVLEICCIIMCVLVNCTVYF